MSRALTAIDLFSGCGGLTLGLKQAGFKVIGAVDIDPLSVETYKANHKKVEVWERDIRDLKVSEIKRKLNLKKGELDLLAGCPPCQGFSSIRTLNGKRIVDDPRNYLIFEFLRFVKGLKPKAVMMENVPGITHDHKFKTFCQQLEDLGYITEYRILDTANYGVPQRRRRMILLASRFGSMDFAPTNEKRKTVKETLGTLSPPGNSGDSLHDFPEKRSDHILTLIKMIPKDGGSRTALGEQYQLECHKKFNGFKDVYGRMAWDDVAPTITSGCYTPSKGRFLHPEADRAITMREAALLQGFPKRYKFLPADSKTAIASMIGNALPPPFIAAHAKQVARKLQSINDRTQRSSRCKNLRQNKQL